MASIPMTITVTEMTKARIMQAAIEQDKSISQMADWLIRSGLKVLYRGKAEKAITDPKQFLEVNKKPTKE